MDQKQFALIDQKIKKKHFAKEDTLIFNSKEPPTFKISNIGFVTIFHSELR